MNLKLNSMISDATLVIEGRKKIDWASSHMPVLNQIRHEFEQTLPFKGLRVAIALHLEAKTAYLAKVIQAGGAKRQNIEEYILLDGRRLYLLAEGRLVNLAAGNGHPVEIMDMTFALQALSLQYVNDEYESLSKKVIEVPYKLDQKVARLKLQSLRISIDQLTLEQEVYLASWSEHA